MKIKFNKSKLAKVGICFAGLIGGLASTFFLVPNRTKIINLGMPEEEEVPETYLSRFVSRFTAASKSENVPVEETYPALSADFDNFEVSWGANNIGVEGNVKFLMRNISDIQLSVDLDIDYNGEKCEVAFALINDATYFVVQDLRIKQSFIESDIEGVYDFQDFAAHFYNTFLEQENEEGLRLAFNIGDILGSLIGGADLSSLTSGAGIGLEVEEVEHEDYVDVNLDVTFGGDEEKGEDPTNLKVLIVIGKEDLDLRKVDLGTVSIGDVTIKGGLNCEVSNSIKLLGLDHPDYPKHRGEFVEFINYANWTDKIFNLLDTRQIGLDVSANLKMNDESGVTNLGYVDIAADLDASELFDIHDLDLNKVITGDVSIDSIYGPNGVEDGDNKITDLLNKFDFNVGIKLGNIVDSVKKEYSNLNLAYYTNEVGHNAGFLSFNEEDDTAVMKAKIDVQTVNYLIGKVPELIDTIDGKKTTKAIKRGEEPVEEGFFDFITSSELVTAIKDGHYEGILGLIDTLKSTPSTIELVLNLSSLGLGATSQVKLVLDAGDREHMPTNVVTITAKDIELNDFVLDAEISTRPYSKAGLEKVDAARDTYDVLDFVPGLFDQVYDIIDTEQAGVKLDGSILDAEGLGFDFEGWTQLDYSQKNGMGSILFNEYKSNPSVASNDHRVDISIDDFSGDHASNNMLFQYSNPTLAKGQEPLRGRFTLKTFDDIIDLVMKLIDQKDRRFMKFLDDILEQLRASLIMKIIDSKDYLQLTQSSYIQSIKQSNDGMALDIFISEKLVPLDFIKSPMHIQVEFGLDGKNQKNLKAIHIVELDLGEKKVNANIELCDYDSNKVNPVDTSKKFLNFSDIAILLEFGINTCELNYYHLTGKLNVSFGLLNANITLDFHVYVNGETTKVYGRLDDLPTLLRDAYSEFVFEPDHDASNNDIGGYFHMVRHDDYNGGLIYQLLNPDKDVYYRASSQYFLDNILTYIIGPIMGYDALSDLGDLDISSSEEVNPLYQNMFVNKGFEYTHTATQDNWDLGIDLGVLVGNNKLGALDATITGTEVGGNGYFTGLTASTQIKVGKTSLTRLDADVNLKLVNPDPSIENWPTAVENRYNQIVGIYTSLSASDKAKCTNNPDSPYKSGYNTL